MSNYKDFDLGAVQASTGGMDAFFEDGPKEVNLYAKAAEESTEKTASTGRRKVASVADLSEFSRRSASTLVHKSDKDLWSLQKDAKGEYFIERMFDDQDAPLKG
jgi:hypothetical protein